MNFPNVPLVLCRGLIYYAKSNKTANSGSGEMLNKHKQSQESPPGVWPAINFNESAQNARKSA